MTSPTNPLPPAVNVSDDDSPIPVIDYAQNFEWIVFIRKI